MWKVRGTRYSFIDLFTSAQAEEEAFNRRTSLPFRVPSLLRSVPPKANQELWQSLKLWKHSHIGSRPPEFADGFDSLNYKTALDKGRSLYPLACFNRKPMERTSNINNNKINCIEKSPRLFAEQN